ncbi:MAG: ferrochelatase [Arenicellales bacterium]
MPFEKNQNAISPKIGVLLTNLGTPNSPSVKDVRAYLKEFLSDSRVVTMPKILWWPVLNFIILNTRPKHSAAAYAKVWTDEGSPLLTISQQQADALQAALEVHSPEKYTLELAMRYGEPSIAHGLEKLKQQNVSRIIVLPLYPQFSHTTTSSTKDALEQAYKKNALPEYFFIEDYHASPAYIEALSSSVQDYWTEHGQAEKLLMSFHGIPQAYVDAGDPYAEQCQKTADLLAKALKLKDSQWQLSFQSRLGPKQWLQPYTDQALKALAGEGVKSVQVMCPGFSADCLETLEEIAIENRDYFLEAGGEHYAYIPCLNDRADHIQALVGLIAAA